MLRLDFVVHCSPGLADIIMSSFLNFLCRTREATDVKYREPPEHTATSKSNVASRLYQLEQAGYTSALQFSVLPSHATAWVEPPSRKLPSKLLELPTEKTVGDGLAANREGADMPQSCVLEPCKVSFVGHKVQDYKSHSGPQVCLHSEAKPMPRSCTANLGRTPLVQTQTRPLKPIRTGDKGMQLTRQDVTPPRTSRAIRRNASTDESSWACTRGLGLHEEGSTASARWSLPTFPTMDPCQQTASSPVGSGGHACQVRGSRSRDFRRASCRLETTAASGQQALSQTSHAKLFKSGSSRLIHGGLALSSSRGLQMQADEWDATMRTSAGSSKVHPQP